MMIQLFKKWMEAVIESPSGLVLQVSLGIFYGDWIGGFVIFFGPSSHGTSCYSSWSDCCLGFGIQNCHLLRDAKNAIACLSNMIESNNLHAFIVQSIKDLLGS